MDGLLALLPAQLIPKLKGFRLLRVYAGQVVHWEGLPVRIHRNGWLYLGHGYISMEADGEAGQAVIRYGRYGGR